MTDHSILEVEGASLSFGGLQALKNVSVRANQGEVTALIGPNGAGKSTLLNAVSGFARLDAGRVMLKGQDITRIKPYEGFNYGLARTFQDLEVMERLTVAENVLLGLPERDAERPLKLLLTPWLANRQYRESVQKTVDLLDRVGLLDRADTLASELSYGEQKLLVVARLLATGAEMLMLDEPGAGLPDVNLHQIGSILRETVANGKSVVLVDHNMDLIMKYADRVTVLHHGEVIASGAPEEIRSDQRVIDVYFSGGHTTSDAADKSPEAMAGSPSKGKDNAS